MAVSVFCCVSVYILDVFVLISMKPLLLFLSAPHLYQNFMWIMHLSEIFLVK